VKHTQFAAKGVWLDANLDLSGRYFTAWKPHASAHFRDAKQLLRWLAWPPKTPTGDAIRAWLSDIATSDAARQKPVPNADSVSVEGSWDPLAHGGALDAADPNFATRTIL
jgi:hypothetical protein